MEGVVRGTVLSISGDISGETVAATSGWRWMGGTVGEGMAEGTAVGTAVASSAGTAASALAAHSSGVHKNPGTTGPLAGTAGPPMTSS